VYDTIHVTNTVPPPSVDDHSFPSPLQHPTAAIMHKSGTPSKTAAAADPPLATSTFNNRHNYLSNTINKQIPSEVPPKPVHHNKKVSPLLPRQNAKIQPPLPPPVIQDKTGSLQYQRMSFLGEVSHLSI
jgi:hypothetical protein